MCHVGLCAPQWTISDSFSYDLTASGRFTVKSLYKTLKFLLRFFIFLLGTFVAGWFSQRIIWLREIGMVARNVFFVIKMNLFDIYFLIVPWGFLSVESRFCDFQFTASYSHNQYVKSLVFNTKKVSNFFAGCSSGGSLNPYLVLTGSDECKGFFGVWVQPVGDSHAGIFQPV